MLGRIGFVALLLVGCAAVDVAPTDNCGFAMTVANHERVDLVIQVNGQMVTSIGPDVAVTLIAGQSEAVPPLPWDVSIIQATDGTVRGTGTFTHESGDVEFVIGPSRNDAHRPAVANARRCS